MSGGRLHTKFTKQDVAHIKYYLAHGYAVAKIARSYNVNYSCIDNIKKEKAWIDVEPASDAPEMIGEQLEAEEWIW